MSEQGNGQESGGGLQSILIGISVILAIIIVALFILFQNAQNDLTETRENATVVSDAAATSDARAAAAQAGATEAAAQATDSAGTAVAAEAARGTAAAQATTAFDAQETAQSRRAQADATSAAASEAESVAESAQATAEQAAALAEAEATDEAIARSTADSQARAGETAVFEANASATAAAQVAMTEAAQAAADATDAAATFDSEIAALANIGERVAATATQAANVAATQAAFATIAVETSRPAFATAQAMLDGRATENAQLAAAATESAADARATNDAQRQGFNATMTAIVPQPAVTDEPGGAGPDDAGGDADADAGALPTPAPDSQIVITEVLGRGDISAETVVIQNNGATVDLSGWTLSDSTGTAYTFPDDLRLFSSAQILVFTRSGQNTAIAYYWGLDSAVFGETGDAVILRDADGNAQAVLTLDSDGAAAPPADDQDGGATGGDFEAVFDGDTQIAVLPDNSYSFDFPATWWGSVALDESGSTVVLNNQAAVDTATEGDGNPRAGETWVFVRVISRETGVNVESVLNAYIAENLDTFTLTEIVTTQVQVTDGSSRDVAYATIDNGDGRFIMVDLGNGSFGFLDVFGRFDEFNEFMSEYMLIAASLRPN